MNGPKRGVLKTRSEYAIPGRCSGMSSPMMIFQCLEGLRGTEKRRKGGDKKKEGRKEGNLGRKKGREERKEREEGTRGGERERK